MSIVTTLIENTEQWHTLRAHNVGASEAAALVGAHDYQTLFGLWARKSGRLEAPKETAAMARGKRLEPLAIEILREQMPQWELEVPHHYYSDPDLGLGCTPDLFANVGDSVGVIQIKSVEASAFRKWGGEPPLGIAVQCNVEQMLTQSDWAAVAALVISHGIELHIMDVPWSPELAERIKREVVEFWRMVEEGRPPDPDFGRDLDAIKQVWREADGAELDLTGDNELPGMILAREAYLAVRREAEDNVKRMDAQLLHRLGSAERARYAGGTITAKTVHRSAYEVPASTYRQLRIKSQERRA